MKVKYDQSDYIRILRLNGSDIWFLKQENKPFIIEHSKIELDYRFKELLQPNLDLLELSNNKKFTVEKLNGEQYTFDIINVSFKYDCLVSKKNKQIKDPKAKFTDDEVDKKLSTTKLKIRESFYVNGFVLNGDKYVKYKRSSSSARTGDCLFIKESLFKKMNKWSNAGLDPKKYTNNIVSFEAYKSLSLSGLIDTVELNPYNILFVDDVDAIIKDEKVARVFYNKSKKMLDVKEEEFKVKNKIWDGEGLLDASIFERIRAYSKSEDILLKTKSMLLLRNRFFKSCVFNTKLQIWFKKNGITSVDQLKKNGFTLAKDIEDIVLVVTKSSLKYVKFLGDKLSERNIKKWCDAISDPDSNTSAFGIVKTDKSSRFFDGEIVELSNALLNTINIDAIDVKRLLKPQIEDYIEKIRNIKETPEYLNHFLKGGSSSFAEREQYGDDSEYSDYEIADNVFSDTLYTFKRTIASALLDCNKDVVNTTFFKHFVYEDVVNSLALKLYNGRILVHGVNATIFGNPYELLLKIVGKFDVVKSHFLHKDEVCCPFFGDANLVGNRNPHLTMGNILCAKNVRNKEIEKWFNLSDEIVIVDAIENNIQQRLNGMDYDSDSVLLTDNELLYENTIRNYQKFCVPVADLNHVPNKIVNKSDDYDENIALNLAKIDDKIANNKIGSISNTAQILNSIYWDRVNNNKEVEDIYLNICKASILCGAEIDSAKRSFDFDADKEVKKLKEFRDRLLAEDNKTAPLFAITQNRFIKGQISAIEDHINRNVKRAFKCTVDNVWVYVKTFKLSGKRITESFELSKLLCKGERQGGSNYDNAKKIINDLEGVYAFKLAGRKSDDETEFEDDKRTLTHIIDLFVKKFRKYFENRDVVRLAVLNIEKKHKENKKHKKKSRGSFILFLLLYIYLYINGENEFAKLFSSAKPIDNLYRNDELVKPKYTLLEKYKYETKLKQA